MAKVVFFFLLVSMMMMMGLCIAELANKSSSGGLFWAPGKDEEAAAAEEEAEELPPLQDNKDDFQEDHSFPSFDSMFQWAIGHSDTEKLKETANDIQRLSANELKNRQLEIKELMEKLKVPSDAELMQIAIADLNNSSLSLEDRHRALEELLILVEPIDNANGKYLNKLGGLVAVIKDLNNSEPKIRTISAWILGKASQNNPVVQKQIVELGALRKLMIMVKSSSIEEAIKALYAVSAVIRSNVDGQELFYSEGGDLILQDIMGNSSIDVRLRRKSASLVASLVAESVEGQLQNTNKAELHFFQNRLFLKSVVDLMASTDLDLQEKALMATKSLLELTSTEALDFKDFCGLDGALERMRVQLEELMLDEDGRDFATDMDNLRREVEFIFRSKLEEVTLVPT
ncbi:hsp70 nucleotide exchange factor FES1-like isoform X1 [Tasmannia lanceolata]|uniref:hsp70 nucleotide exchange factor FES1-like isoform X1 n=1 Tax=Tasmannia lanceolata TaxID=3420 RepID=UPI004063A822